MKFLVWFGIALSIIAVYWVKAGADNGLQLATGYFLELTLSVDNLVVMYVILSHFKIPKVHHNRILFIGIAFAIVARILFIYFGLEILEHFKWAQYVFALILQVSAIQFVRDWASKKKDQHEVPQEGAIVRFLKKHLRYKHDNLGPHFFVRENNKLYVTAAFMALTLIETSDIIFAFDSVPAVLSVTRIPVIAITSNILAIFGLRSLYNLIVRFVDRWTFLKPGLAVLLSFVAIKLALAHVIEISSVVSLGFVGGTILISILGSHLYQKRALN